MLHKAKEDISVDGSLVGLVQHDDLVLHQIPVNQTLSQQHAVRHVLDLGLRAGAVLKTDGVAHLGQDSNRVTPGDTVCGISFFKLTVQGDEWVVFCSSS